MSRFLAPGLAAASLALLAACQPPPPTPAAQAAPVTAPGLGGDAAPVAVTADQVQAEPIPGLAD